jgi:starch-binding outer membrane protein, SusD/RagB family
MKKIKLLLFAIPVLFIATSCEKFLNQQPISDISNDLFWKTPADARLGIAGLYDGVQSAIGTGGFSDWGDARSDNFTFGGTGTNQIGVTLNGLTAVSPSSEWENFYMAINRANIAIKNLPRVTGLTELQRNDYLAQAHAIRAFLYFYLVRVWGDVPVVTEPYEDLSVQPDLTRVPATTVLNDVILKDLNTAYTLSDKAKVSTYEISTGAILAMLADVHIWKKDYAKVLEVTTTLQQLKRYDLAATEEWKKLFIEPGSTAKRENIWSLYWDWTVDFEDDGRGNGDNNFNRLGSGSNTANYIIDQGILAKFEANKDDIRRRFTYDTLLAIANDVDIIAKFYPIGANGRPEYPSNQQNNAKLPIYRYAGILLLRAEALNKTGNQSAAISIVNDIRTRANAPTVDPTNYTTEEQVENLILDERQLELFGEGKRWFDLVRTGKVLEVMDPIIRQRQQENNQSVTGFTDPRYILWPISRNALTRNPLLVQNPPYAN